MPRHNIQFELAGRFVFEATGKIMETPAGYLEAWGVTVPIDGSTGYAPGCKFRHTDGSANDFLYVNGGSVSSCKFNALIASSSSSSSST